MNKEQHKYKNQWKHNDIALGEISTHVLGFVSIIVHL